MTPNEVFAAAHHEAAHAVVCVVLGLPLQDRGIHIDTLGGGICFNLHRKPGDLKCSDADVVEREHSITMIKAGYVANCKLFPGCPASIAADDRAEEKDLLTEMFQLDDAKWQEADAKLSGEAQRLVDQYWTAIEAVASVLLGKPITQRTSDTASRWTSVDSHERWISGEEVAAILEGFELSPIVRSEADGCYLSPKLYPNSGG
jgi:hypothetical protein